MKYWIVGACWIVPVISMIAGCGKKEDTPSIREQRQQMDIASYENATDIKSVQRWRMAGSTWVEVFKDPDTRCEYLIVGGKSIIPRMRDKDLDGKTTQICY